MSDEPLFGGPLPQEVARADGSLYRARKPPIAIRVHLCGYGPGTTVLRCHDRETAVAVALDANLVPLADLDALDRGPLWVRYVVQYDAYERELRGTSGATPAYLFAPAKPVSGHPEIYPLDQHTAEGSTR